MSPDLRAVLVTSGLTSRPRTGGAIRTHRLARALGEAMMLEVVVVGDAEDAERTAASVGASSIHVYPWPASPIRKRWTAARNRWPLYFSWSWNSEGARKVQDLAFHGCAVVLDHLQMWPYRVDGLPYVLSLHNIESRLLGELPKPRGWRRIERTWEQHALNRCERSAIADPMARVVVVSGDDKEFAPDAVVVPNGADIPEDVPDREQRGPVLFIANMVHEPNVRAVEWWAREVWPHRSDLPPLTVIGLEASTRLAHLRDHPAVDIVGEVDDVTVHLEGASIVAVPLQQGGGSRLKILEAMAWALPVVTTAKGAEGLDVTPGEDLVVADDPRDFADCIARLCADAVTRSRLGRAARQQARTYSWDVVAPAFVDVVRRVADEVRV